MTSSVEATASPSGVAQEQVASARGDQERSHPGKEQLASATGFRSLSFPKLKSLVRPRSIQEPNAKLTAAMVEDRHHTLAPVSSKVEEPESVGVCPTAAGQRQEERRDSEKQSCDVNTVRALPKLNLLDRFGAGLFKKLRDKEVGDNMESEEQIYQQHPSANLSRPAMEAWPVKIREGQTLFAHLQTTWSSLVGERMITFATLTRQLPP